MQNIYFEVELLESDFTDLGSAEAQQVCPELPLEIQYRIIEVFKNDHPSLLQLSLVAKSWLRFTRNDLFNSMTLWAEHIIPFLQTVQSSLCTIRECVQSLQLQPFRGNRGTIYTTTHKVSNMEFAAIAQLLPNLRYLSLNYFPISHLTHSQKESFQKSVVHVEVLSLRGMNTVLLGKCYIDFISSFPSLRKFISAELPPFTFWNDIRVFSPMLVLPGPLEEMVLSHPHQRMMDFLEVAPSARNIRRLELVCLMHYRIVMSAVKVLENIGEGLVHLTLQLDDEGIDLRKNPWNFSKNTNLETLVLHGDLSYTNTGHTWITEILEKVESPSLRRLVFSVRQFHEGAFKQRWPHAAMQSVFQRRRAVFERLEEVVYVARGGNKAWGETIKAQVGMSFSAVARGLWEGRNVFEVQHAPVEIRRRRRDPDL